MKNFLVIFFLPLMFASCSKRSEDKVDNPEKFIYQVYYNADMMDDKGPEYGTYNNAMKDKFKELGIDKPYDESPYANVFNQYLEDIDNAQRRTGDILGFDWDILWETQDGVVDFGFEITKTEIFPAAIIETQWNNGSTKTFFLIQEEGKWKILDMVYKNDFVETDYLIQAKEILKDIR